MTGSTPTLGSVLTAEDRLDIEDALARFAAGIDENDPTTLGSVFTADATLDFSPGGSRHGHRLPCTRRPPRHPRRRRDERRPMDTLHSATNVRVLEGDENAVRVAAIVNAIHHPAGVRDRHCSMHNRYDMSFVRTTAGWRMSRLVIENRFWTGDPQVVLGR
jgi:SnoaL-like domain